MYDKTSKSKSSPARNTLQHSRDTTCEPRCADAKTSFSLVTSFVDLRMEIDLKNDERIAQTGEMDRLLKWI